MVSIHYKKPSGLVVFCPTNIVKTLLNDNNTVMFSKNNEEKKNRVYRVVELIYFTATLRQVHRGLHGNLWKFSELILHA